MNIGKEEYNFYKIAAEQDEKTLCFRNDLGSKPLSYTDTIKLNAYIEFFHLISKRAKDLIKAMIVNNVEEALDLSIIIEGLSMTGINKNLSEVEDLYKKAKKLIDIYGFRNAFDILLGNGITINNLMEEKIQNSFVPSRDRILYFKSNGINLSTNRFKFGISSNWVIALGISVDRYFKEENFRNFSELYDLYLDLIIGDTYIKNIFEIICKKLDTEQIITTEDKNKIINDIKEYSKNLNSSEIKNIITNLSVPKLERTFNALIGGKFENPTIFIINTIIESS